MSLRLTVISNQDMLGPYPASISWHGSRPLLIGRGPGADWVLPDRIGAISARHCEMTTDGSEFRLRDLSRNGTYLNSGPDRVTGETPLRKGDVIGIGHFTVE